ncbi:hypothetical protein MASR2M117_07640 [Paludibacter sp.]
MSKIYKNSFSYIISKLYIVWSFRKYFSEVIITGLENIPENEAVIYAPNHRNALMDALAILSLPPFKTPKIFLARADLFHLHRLIVKFIQWTKIMPAYRIRDGYDNLAKNQESFVAADEVLLNNAAMCIMPEGNQELEHRVRPLVKGIFRIALSAQQKLPIGKSVYILPIGLNYGDIIKQGKHLIINIGKPIAVSEYIDEYLQNPASTINNIKERLSKELEQLSLHISSKENYEIFEDIVQIVNEDVVQWMELEKTTINLFKARQKTVQILDKSEIVNPEKIDILNKLSRRYKDLLQNNNLPFTAFNRLVPSRRQSISNSLKITVLSILAIPGIILNLLPYTITSQIPKWMKIEFKGFYSSVYYVGGIILFPLFYILQGIALTSASGLPLIYVFIFLIAQYYIGKCTMYFVHRIKIQYNQLRFYHLYRKKTEEFEELQSLKVSILHELRSLFD